MIAKDNISLLEYLNNKHIEYPDEFNAEILENAEELLVRVNTLLQKEKLKAIQSSGFRPPSYNKTIKGAAKNSWHTKGAAIDLYDPEKTLAKCITGINYDNEKLLVRYDLWAEHPKYTRNWLHLQSKPVKSGRRIFKPW